MLKKTPDCPIHTSENKIKAICFKLLTDLKVSICLSALFKPNTNKYGNVANITVFNFLIR